MAKIKRYTSVEGGYNGELAIMCPGCKCKHWIFDKETKGQSKCWEFNGDFDRPTISPSLLVWNYGQNPATGKYDIEINRCHSFIRNGQIQFLNDCDHALAGTTVELPQIE